LPTGNCSDLVILVAVAISTGLADRGTSTTISMAKFPDGPGYTVATPLRLSPLTVPVTP
jgi:hypothetical protein